MTVTTWTRSSSARSGSTTTRRTACASSATLCAETLAGIADPLFPSLAGAACVAPLSAARTVLGTMAEPLECAAPPSDLPSWLLPHQTDAVVRAWAITERFGGVLVADGAGLGKTYVGLALASLARRDGAEALVVAPAALRREWERASAEVGEPLSFLSHTALARAPRVPCEGVGLLLVDEAHGFRNPRTRRYDALARLAVGRRVVLLSATPVNNSTRDLIALIHLFAGTERFRDLGVADLFAALRGPGSAEASLALAAITVCRSRRLVEARFPGLRRAFPRRELLPPVRYDLRAVLDGALEETLDALAELQEIAGDGEPGAPLLVLGLLRRLESSRAAFLRTLRRHDAYLREWATARGGGQSLTRREFRRACGGADGAEQMALWPLLLDCGAATGPAVHGWAEVVSRLLATAEAARALPDPKADALAAALDGPLRGRKTIVFTEYRDTALALARSLRHRTRVLCVAGEGAWAGGERLSRREALDAFAPRSRSATPSRLLDADVLVATDVASEGMNLQDACAVVNYDLPWNPVRVMQRIGRIDRLHSPHETVAVTHVLPDGGMRDLAGVLRVLRAKLERSVGVTAEPDPLSALWWLDAPGPLTDALERESWRRVEPFEARERWRASAGPAMRLARPCLAAGLVDDGLGPAAGVLLALEWADGTRLPLAFVLEPGGAVRCDPQALGALAERTLAARPLVAAPADFRTALAAVLPEARRRLLAYSAARHGSPAQGPGRRAALLAVARCARRANASRDAAALTLLDDVSARLTQEVPAGVDRTLVEVCASAASADALPARLAAALRCIAQVSSIELRHSPRLMLVAALAIAGADPGAEAASHAA